MWKLANWKKQPALEERRVEWQSHVSLPRFHWGLDFQGLSVGNEKGEAIFCGDDDRTSGTVALRFGFDISC